MHKIRRISLAIIAMWLTAGSLLAQKGELKIEPPYWWADMPVREVQLMINGDGIGFYTATINYPGVRLIRNVSGDSPNYLFVYLDVTKEAKPGRITIDLSYGKKKKQINYELKARENDPTKNQGFSSKDVIYLLMPDRFANGNPDNDSYDDMFEKANRENPNGRHGGDIKGIQDHLDYIKEAGMTAVWTTPVFENDMPVYEANGAGAYHGYAATNMYAIDRRFGTNEEFRTFVKTCHENDIKVIFDMIHNHVGSEHPWMKDLPTKDWVHDWDTYGQTNYRGATQSDPHASEYDRNKTEKGWFVKGMPDLNQENELLADYLILNTLWWIEFSGVDGIRMDTYVYPDKTYIARWAKEVIDAYPTFNIVGEAWLQTAAHESYWQKDLPGVGDGYNSNLPSLTDFPMMNAMNAAMNEGFGWTSGLMQLYYYLSKDRLYSNPDQNVIFLDNHDTERFFTTIGQNADKFKMAYAYLMTMRGIPQVYYGTELMFANEPVEGHGRRRQDMPGGWPGDETTIFTESGRSESQNAIFDYTSKITNWRQSATAIHNGTTTHFLPEDNVYVYFRYNDEQKVMVIMNMNESSKAISRQKHIELLRGISSGKNIVTDQTLDLSKDFEVAGMTTTILELN